jgi:hypothetical protein
VDFTKEMCESVLETLQTTWDLKTPDLKRVAQAIEVEEEVVMEVYKKLRQSQRAAKKKRRMEAERAAAEAEAEGANRQEEPEQALSLEGPFEQYEKAVDSFRSLFCRRCYVYDCDYHGCVEVPKLEITEQNAVTLQAQERDLMVGTGRNCGNQCFLGQMGSTNSARFSKANVISSTFGWDKATQIACARAYFICSGNYCEVAKLLGNKTCLEVAEFCAQNDINHKNIMRGVRLAVYRVVARFWMLTMVAQTVALVDAAPHSTTPAQEEVDPRVDLAPPKYVLHVFVCICVCMRVCTSLVTAQIRWPPLSSLGEQPATHVTYSKPTEPTELSPAVLAIRCVSSCVHASIHGARAFTRSTIHRFATDQRSS